MTWISAAWGGLAIVVLAVLLGADSPPALAPSPLAVTPVFQRLDLDGGAVVERTLTLVSPVACTVLSVDAGCRCVHMTTPLPLQVAAGVPATLTLSIAGSIPGAKVVTIRTTAGVVTVGLQVVSGGLGVGIAHLTALLATARHGHLGLVVIAHDLAGAVRNCGCSAGSLGGIDHLAALPRWLAAQLGDVPARCVLTGDADGHRRGVEAALIAAGWCRDSTIAVTADPAADLLDGKILAVIATAPTAVNHRKLIVPILAGGMTLEVLLVDGAGQIQEHAVIPVDRTFPSDPAVLAGFQDVLTSAIAPARVPSDACTSCHAGAHGAWLTSRHAAAWFSLKEPDRTDACIVCHSTPIAAPAPTVAPGVHCQSCHAGADAHAAAPATVKTAGATDCRACHDARHDPGFEPVKAWAAIAHGK